LRLPDVLGDFVQSDRVSTRKFQIFVWHDREIDVDQEKIGGNELACAKEIANSVSVLPPEFCQKGDSVARKIVLPVIFVKQNRNRAGSGIHSPIILWLKRS
jgi:hypothetical protein